MIQVITFLALFVFCVTSADWRITSGTRAQEGQFPFVSYSIVEVSRSKSKLCTGSILNDRTILTTASCLGTRTRPNAAVGTTMMFGRGRQELRVARLIMHPDFDSTAKDNLHIYDLAVIKLSKPIAFGRNVRPVALNCNPNATDTKEDTRTIIVEIPGFGIDQSFTNRRQGKRGILRFAQQKIVDCDGDSLFDEFAFCTTPISSRVRQNGGGTVVPNGAPNAEDGGAPTVIYRNGQPQLIGVATGSSTGNKFTNMRIETYCNWIQRQM